MQWGRSRTRKVLRRQSKNLITLIVSRQRVEENTESMTLCSMLIATPVTESLPVPPYSIDESAFTVKVLAS